jgi:hypothetical protein
VLLDGFWRHWTGAHQRLKQPALNFRSIEYRCSRGVAASPSTMQWRLDLAVGRYRRDMILDPDRRWKDSPQPVAFRIGPCQTTPDSTPRTLLLRPRAFLIDTEPPTFDAATCWYVTGAPSRVRQMVDTLLVLEGHRKLRGQGVVDQIRLGVFWTGILTSI